MGEPRFAGLSCDDVAVDAAGFVLGALEPAAALAIQRHLAECPGAHPGIDELGFVIPTLLDSVPLVAPPDGLRERVRAAVAAQAGAKDSSRTLAPAAVSVSVAVTGAVAQEPVVQEPGAARGVVVGQIGPGRSRWVAGSRLLGIAAAVAIVVLGSWNLTLQSRLADADRYRAAMTAVFDLAARPNSTAAILATGTGSGPSGLVAIGADGSVAMAMRGLTPTPGTKVYEAWIIVKGGSPVPIGGFAVGPDGVGQLATSVQVASLGAVIAVTLEPSPGATSPTLPIVVSGSAEARAG